MSDDNNKDELTEKQRAALESQWNEVDELNGRIPLYVIEGGRKKKKKHFDFAKFFFNVLDIIYRILRYLFALFGLYCAYKIYIIVQAGRLYDLLQLL